MTSRATGMRPQVKKALPVKGRDFPDEGPFEARRAVCRRCSLIMTDGEPMTRFGEFYHGARPHQTRAARCSNHGKTFGVEDREIEPFMRKKLRRALKRAGVRA